MAASDLVISTKIVMALNMASLRLCRPLHLQRTVRCLTSSRPSFDKEPGMYKVGGGTAPISDFVQGDMLDLAVNLKNTRPG